MKDSAPDYRAFAKDLMKLCKKHGVKLSASNHGLVFLGPDNAKITGDYPFSDFSASPEVVEFGDVFDAKHNGALHVKVTRDEKPKQD